MIARTTAVTYALLLPACAGNPPAQSPDSEPHDRAAYSDENNSSNTTNIATDSSPRVSDRDGIDDSEAMNSDDDGTTDVTPTQRVPKTINATNSSGSGDTTNVDEPSSAASAKNTVNERQDRGRKLTPMAQGNSDAELKITASIRQSIMKDDSLSFNAKNAKVITVGSKVTLEGLVNTETEKARIEALARLTEGVTAVDNHLLVDK
jgi:hyperosmotically inducible periplasmic protein